MYNGIYPVRINPYTPPVKKKNTEELTSDSQQPQQPKANEEKQNQGNNSNGSFSSNIDYTSTKVNISQILVDFRNTLTAIGAPSDVEKEVKGYLDLVNVQSQKAKPSKQIIVGNLKNASTILDEYITSALQKPSNVVQGWIDALLLQQVDYKSDNKTEKVSIADESAKSKPADASEKENLFEAKTTGMAADIDLSADTTAKEPYLPQDKDLKRIYLNAQKYKEIGDNDKALSAFAKAVKYAKTIDDKETQAQIFLNVAEIQDDKNCVPEALKCYNNSAKLSAATGDTVTRAKAHSGMAGIYDEVGKFDAAMDHYFTVLSLDGENENLKSQAMTLNDIGSMHALKYEHGDAVDYYKLALGLAKEIPDADAMGTILSNTAGVFKNAGKDTTALKYYGDSIKCDLQVGKYKECSLSYEQAGDIMLDMDFEKKASSLYNKALKAASKINDDELSTRLAEKLQNITA